MLRAPGALATTRPTSLRSLRAMVICLSAGALMLAIPLFGNTGVYATALAMLILVLGVVAYRWQTGGLDAFETIVVIGLLHFTYFGLGAIWAIDDPQRTAHDPYLYRYVPREAFYCLLGMAAMVAGYMGPWFRPMSKLTREMRPTHILFLLVPGVIGFLGALARAALAKATWLGAAIPAKMSSLGQLAPLFQFVWGLGWLLVLSGRATRQQKWFVYGFLTPAALVIISTNLASKSLIMTVLGVPLMSLWYARRRFPWVSMLVLLLILIFVVFPFYNNFRVLDGRIPTGRRVEMTLDQMKTWDARYYMDQSVGEFKARMALVSSVAVVVRDVPDSVPYRYGETLFLPALANIVPRFVWPDKPLFFLGRQFGEIFHMRHMLDQESSIEPTTPGELYWNFDLPGIIVGMGLFGAAMRWTYRRYNERLGGLDPVRRAIHMILILEFLHFGAGMAVRSAATARTVVILELLCFAGYRLGWLGWFQTGSSERTPSAD